MAVLEYSIDTSSNGYGVLQELERIRRTPVKLAGSVKSTFVLSHINTYTCKM